MRLAPHLVALSLGSLALAMAPACNEEDGAAQPDPTEPDPTEPDPTEPDPEIPDEPDQPLVEYPDGPYGGEYLDTIADLAFYDPWMGVDYSFSDYLADPATKVIVVTSGAGWCTACQYEAWDLVETYDKYHLEGLEVFYTLYEDTKGKEIWREGASADEIDADFTFMNEWKDWLGNWIDLEVRQANYPVLVDIGFQLGAYYDRAATPLTLIVRTSDMKILYRQIGYNPGAIETIVKGVLFSGH